MIFTFLISIPAYLIQAVVNFLPAGQAVPSEWISAVHSIWSYIEAFSFILPVDVMLWCLGVALGFHLAIFGFKVFHWIITKIPFIG